MMPFRPVPEKDNLTINQIRNYFNSEFLLKQGYTPSQLIAVFAELLPRTEEDEPLRSSGNASKGLLSYLIYMFGENNTHSLTEKIFALFIEQNQKQGKPTVADIDTLKTKITGCLQTYNGNRGFIYSDFLRYMGLTDIPLENDIPEVTEADKEFAKSIVQAILVFEQNYNNISTPSTIFFTLPSDPNNIYKITKDKFSGYKVESCLVAEFYMQLPPSLKKEFSEKKQSNGALVMAIPNDAIINVREFLKSINDELLTRKWDFGEEMKKGKTDEQQKGCLTIKREAIKENVEILFKYCAEITKTEELAAVYYKILYNLFQDSKEKHMTLQIGGVIVTWLTKLREISQKTDEELAAYIPPLLAAEAPKHPAAISSATAATTTSTVTTATTNGNGHLPVPPPKPQNLGAFAATTTTTALQVKPLPTPPSRLPPLGNGYTASQPNEHLTSSTTTSSSSAIQTRERGFSVTTTTAPLVKPLPTQPLTPPLTPPLKLSSLNGSSHLDPSTKQERRKVITTDLAAINRKFSVLQTTPANADMSATTTALPSASPPIKRSLPTPQVGKITTNTNAATTDLSPKFLPQRSRTASVSEISPNVAVPSACLVTSSQKAEASSVKPAKRDPRFLAKLNATINEQAQLTEKPQNESINPDVKKNNGGRGNDDNDGKGQNLIHGNMPMWT